jgi:hypothetical protein
MDRDMKFSKGANFKSFKARLIGVGTTLFFIGSVIFLKMSKLCIERVWQAPSRLQGQTLKTWPPNLNFKLPFRTSTNGRPDFFYVTTNSYGALNSSDSPPKAWVLGGFRTTLLRVPVKLRWPNLLSISTFNFALPGLSMNEVKVTTEQLLNTIQPKPSWIILGDFSLRHKDFIFPDLNGIQIWGKNATSHPLYELLCFFWFSPFCQMKQDPSKTAFGPPPVPSKEELILSFSEFGRQIVELKPFLATQDISLFGTILPFSSQAPQWRREYNVSLKNLYRENQIAVLDLDECFQNANSDSELFFEDNTFTKKGNQLVARCMDKYFIK